MTVTAVPDPKAWTIFEGDGSNQTLVGRVMLIEGVYSFTPEPAARTSAATMRLIADKLDALNAP